MSASSPLPPPRDPTREELHDGPSREELPSAVQDMERDETVCRFCGVSYLVFSEVKELEKRLATSEATMRAQADRIAAADALQARCDQLEKDRASVNAELQQLRDRAAEAEHRGRALEAKHETLLDNHREQLATATADHAQRLAEVALRLQAETERREGLTRAAAAAGAATRGKLEALRGALRGEREELEGCKATFVEFRDAARSMSERLVGEVGALRALQVAGEADQAGAGAAWAGTLAKVTEERDHAVAEGEALGREAEAHRAAAAQWAETEATLRGDVARLEQLDKDAAASYRAAAAATAGKEDALRAELEALRGAARAELEARGSTHTEDVRRLEDEVEAMRGDARRWESEARAAKAEQAKEAAQAAEQAAKQAEAGAQARAEAQRQLAEAASKGEGLAAKCDASLRSLAEMEEERRKRADAELRLQERVAQLEGGSADLEAGRGEVRGGRVESTVKCVLIWLYSSTSQVVMLSTGMNVCERCVGVGREVCACGLWCSNIYSRTVGAVWVCECASVRVCLIRFDKEPRIPSATII